MCANDFASLDFTSIISYGAGNPIAPDDLVDTMVRTTDELLVPSIPEPQLVADRFIELGIFFDTFVRSILLFLTESL